MLVKTYLFFLFYFSLLLTWYPSVDVYWQGTDLSLSGHPPHPWPATDRTETRTSYQCMYLAEQPDKKKERLERLRTHDSLSKCYRVVVSFSVDDITQGSDNWIC